MARPAILAVIGVLCVILGYQLTQLSQGNGDPRGKNSRSKKSLSSYSSSNPSSKVVKAPPPPPPKDVEVNEEAAEEVLELVEEGISIKAIMKGTSVVGFFFFAFSFLVERFACDA